MEILNSMFNKVITATLILTFSLNSLATECQTSVKLLEEGSPAPCRGYLFSPEKELDTRIKIKDYSLLKDEINSLNQIVDRMHKKEMENDRILELEQQKTDLWKTRAEDITLKYVSVEESRGRRDFMFVLLGVGLTALAAWSIGQATQGR